MIERLSKSHDRSGFDCGVLELNNFIRNTARQQAERHIGVTYVACPSIEDRRVIGCYTLAAESVDGGLFPDRGPGVRSVPVILLGRLAVDVNYNGMKLGKRLLLHALDRAHRVSEEIGAYAVVLDAMSNEARTFYEHFGFASFHDDKCHMFIPMKRIAKLGLNRLYQ